ncbi:MAG: putative secreted protein [Pseudomonas sp.]|nr:putative secreted protein [Pseudomonas sp.]
MSRKGEEVRTCREGILLLLTLVLSACSNAPSVPVLGAYFPDWLFCILSAVLLAFVLHALLTRSGVGAWLAPSALTYPVLTVLFALCTWLLFFQS